MIIDAFDGKTEAVIHPAQIAPPVDGFPSVAVVTFEERVISALRRRYAPRLIGEMGLCVKIPIYQVVCEGREIAVYCSTLGGSASAELQEEMISKGCGRFVFFGSCGALNREIAEGSLIIPTAAYRDEGTSYHYAPPGEYIEVTTAARLAAILSELKLPHALGKTWTTDALYRETRGNVEKRVKGGCIAVEMECASVMAVAQFRKVSAYQFLYAADSLGETAWDARTLGKLPEDAGERFLRIALEVALRI